MPTGLLEENLAGMPKNVRLMALDIGSEPTGLAVCDPAHSIATPLTTIRRTKFTRDIQEMHKLIKDYEIGGYVLAYPLNMDGTAGPRCDATQSFAAEMLNYPQIVGADPWIAFWDERLSTVSVEGFVGKFVNINKAKKKGVIDKLAAQHILQGALEYIQASS